MTGGNADGPATACAWRSSASRKSGFSETSSQLECANVYGETERKAMYALTRTTPRLG